MKKESGDLILLTRTNGLALSVIDQSGNGGGTIGATGSVLIVRRETRPSCAVGTVYEFVPEAITSMETVKRRNMDDYMHYQGYKLPCKSAIEKPLAFKSALLTSTKASFVRSNFIARVSTASL